MLKLFIYIYLEYVYDKTCSVTELLLGDDHIAFDEIHKSTLENINYL